MNDHLPLLGLALSSLGTLLVAVWRFSAAATTIRESNRNLQEASKSNESLTRQVQEQSRDIIELKMRVQQLESANARVVSWMPKAQSQLDVHGEAIKHSKEYRAITIGRGSRPDVEDDK